MILTFALSLVFSVGYCTYWVMGWFGIQVSSKPLNFQLDSFGKVASLAYIALNLLTNLVLVIYFSYLKVSYRLSKQ